LRRVEDICGSGARRVPAERSQNFDEHTDANDDFGFFSTTCRRAIARPEENHQKSTNKLMETRVSFYFEPLTGAASRAEQARDLRVSSWGT
jgi:hypothetical protein